jgi:hypothetical protein
MMLLVLINTAQVSALFRAVQITIWWRILRGYNHESLNPSLPQSKIP